MRARQLLLAPIAFAAVLDDVAWAWPSTFEWAADPEPAIRERALKARLVADLVAR